MLETEAQQLVRSDTREGVRIITLANPPVNAISYGLAAALIREITAAEGDSAVAAVVLTGANGTFCGGADIQAFRTAMPPGAKTTNDVVDALEAAKKTYVAAIDGVALGGGLEIALACDFRLAAPTSKVGFPEILLGLIPGAGGTQRLPRLLATKNPMNNGLAGVQMALDTMLKGETKTAKQAKGMGIVDEIVEGDLVAQAIDFAREHLSDKVRVAALRFRVPPPMVAIAHGMVPAEERGGRAAHALIDAVEAASQLDYRFGTARESRIFHQLVRGEQSQAAVHLFFAERELAKIPGLPAAEAAKVASAAVVGAGTMGTGIAMVFANAGIPVRVLDVNAEQVERGRKAVADTYAGQVKKGRLTADAAKEREAAISFVAAAGELRDADLVVEAVFESMSVKKQVFADLDAALKPGAILATNTSTLDIDEIAAATSRPENVLGLHFFAPANIMQLLEVVRGEKTDAATLTTAMGLAKKLRKKGVLSGNAFGFIGNRMLFDYVREASFLLEEGATPAQVDAAIKEFGFPMGPFAMSDLSGVDVFYKISLEAPDPGYRQSAIATRLYERGRYGQKTGSGFFRYEPGSRDPIRDEDVEDIIADESRSLGIARRTIDDREIVERCMFALVNQGAQLLGDDIALRPGDEDIVWVYGYGFPWYKGGPMWWADGVGVGRILEQIRTWQKTLGPHWQPAPELEKAAERGSFVPHVTAGAA